uniref:Uncharacterized protein n=1 Tax=Cajanus cajan TaxID=3821 RepID=A0A151T957_CAJCA|nr:hypothetical protein KK1_018156 [Cajanus cajan]
MAMSSIRGLLIFISEQSNIYNCQNKDQKRLYVDKELDNIVRSKNEKVCTCLCFPFSIFTLIATSWLFFHCFLMILLLKFSYLFFSILH